MEVPRFRTLEKSLRSRQMFIRKLSWLTATAGLALALTLAVGCKNQQPAAGQTGQQEARTDPQISNDIQAKIQGESALGGQNIQVSVSNGVATLSGTVTDDASRALAGNDSGTVLGVRTVVNNLTVQPRQQASAPPPPPAKAPKEQPRHDRPNHEQAGAAPPPRPMPQPPSSGPAPPRSLSRAACSRRPCTASAAASGNTATHPRRWYRRASNAD